jgi:hypothetical protein
MSNTHLLHKRGWLGACVDIDSFKLRTMRWCRGANLICHNGAVSADALINSTGSIYKFGKGRLSTVDTLSKDVADHNKANGAGEYTEVTINLIEINYLLATLPHVNFLNIDIEGSDNDVILALDFKKFRPDVILFEDNEAWGGNETVQMKLTNAGYKLLFISAGSVCYALPLN